MRDWVAGVDLAGVVQAAEQPVGAEVKDLLGAVGGDAGGEGDVQPAPRLAVLLPWADLAGLDAGVGRESGAPRGSTYFHFPGGKQELAREAIARAGDEMEEMVDEAARHADDPGSLVRALARIVASRLERSAYQSGCAIATMVLELAPRDEEFSADFDTGSGGYESWSSSAGRAAKESRT